MTRSSRLRTHWRASTTLLARSPNSSRLRTYWTAPDAVESAGMVVEGDPGGVGIDGMIIGAVPTPRPHSASTARPAWRDGVSHVVTRPAREIVT